MDGNGSMNLNWGYFEPTATVLKGHLGLQLMSSMDEKPLFGNTGDHHQQHHHDLHHHQTHQPHHPTVMESTNGGAFHHHRVCGFSEFPSMPMDYMRDAWLNHKDYREKYFSNVLSGNHHYLTGYGFLPETSSAQSMQMNQLPNLVKVEPAPQLEEVFQERDKSELAKKRGAGKSQLLKSPKTKKAKKATRAPKDESTPSIPRARAPRKSAEILINGIYMDISGIPIPICSCTGAAQQCYRWGCGGWQSACCTTNLSSYPLPINTKRRGSRIAGRKMSLGAFKKVLEKLASEGYNFSNPIDLKPYWAKHGTNKFVTIR